jgi:hypothetical protein
MSKPEGGNRRRRYFVDPTYQLPYLWRFCLLFLSIVVVTAFLTLSMDMLLRQATAGAYWRKLFMLQGLMVAAYILFLIWLSFRISHKIAGPAYRVKRLLDQVSQVKRPVYKELRVRRTDADQWLYEAMDKAARARQERTDGFFRLYGRAAQRLRAVADRIGAKDAETLREIAAVSEDEERFFEVWGREIESMRQERESQP